MAESAGAAGAAFVLHRAEAFRGLPSHLLTLPDGDSVRVLEHGAHIVSWISSGRERLFMSSTARFDGTSALRGGVPVCFPQFNQRGTLPKHGFVRNRPWTFAHAWHDAAQGACLTLSLQDDAATRVIWPQAYRVELTVHLRPGALDVVLDVYNTDAVPLAFTGALHTYLRVHDIARTSLRGLEGCAEWDAVRDVHGHAAAELRFAGEFDRVYAAPPGALELCEEPGGPALRITHSPNWAETVVWTPGASLAATLPDLPAAEAAHMLCVEAAQVMQPMQVPPGGRWQGRQCLTVLP